MYLQRFLRELKWITNMTGRIFLFIYKNMIWSKFYLYKILLLIILSIYAEVLYILCTGRLIAVLWKRILQYMRTQEWWIIWNNLAVINRFIATALDWYLYFSIMFFYCHKFPFILRRGGGGGSELLLLFMSENWMQKKSTGKRQKDYRTQ